MDDDDIVPARGTPATASGGTRWRAERLVGESDLHGQRFRVLGRFETEREAKDACDVDVAMGATALFGCWYITDMTRSRHNIDERKIYRPPNAHLR